MSNKIYAKYHFKIFDNLIVKKRLEIANLIKSILNCLDF